MAVESKAVVHALQTVLHTLHQNPYPHVPNPEGCKRRASVAVIIRVRPPFKPVPPSSESMIELDSEAPASSINHFFSKDWVQEGDPEILFIKRAGRPGDRWSGHTALPGGKKDPEDADDLAAAIRETREEIGLDLESDSLHCIHAGNLPERVVTTTWGKEALMVLCPYIFLLTSRHIPTLQPQPTEVAGTHWVSLRALLSPGLRTLEYVDISSRMAKQGGPVARYVLRSLMGKMMFSAIRLVPSESVYASSTPGFIPEPGLAGVSGRHNYTQIYGQPESSETLAFQQPILLWGLTLGVLADFLDMLPPYNAVALWRYPTFTTPDLKFLIYLFTRNLRKNNAGDLSSGTWPSNTAVDAGTQATTPVADTSSTVQHKENAVGIGGMGVGTPKHAVGHLLIGYYERINVAIAVFLAYRTIVGGSLAYWLYRTWKRRRTSRI